MGTPRKTWVGSQSSFSCGLYYVSSKTKCVDQNFCLLISCFLQLNFLRRMTMFSVMMQRQLLQIFLIQLHSKPRKWFSLSLRSPDMGYEGRYYLELWVVSGLWVSFLWIPWIRLSQITPAYWVISSWFSGQSDALLWRLRWQASSFILFCHGDFNQIDSSLVLGMVRRSITLEDLQSKADNSKSARLSTSYLPC